MPTLLDGEDLLKAYRRSDKTFEGYFNTLIEDYINKNLMREQSKRQTAGNG